MQHILHTEIKFIMANNILNYFEKKKKPADATEVLDEIEITSVIRNEIKIQLEESKQPKKRKYQTYTPEQRAEIGEYASLHGVSKAFKKFKPTNQPLKQQSISDFKKLYNESRKKQSWDQCQRA